MHDQKPTDNLAECLKISLSFIVIEMHTAVAIEIAPPSSTGLPLKHTRDRKAPSVLRNGVPARDIDAHARLQKNSILDVPW
jgi:hypothetical protein